MASARCGRNPATGFTLIEMLVVVGIIAMMLSIIMPVLVVVRGMVNSFNCLSNMGQVGHAMLAYTNNNRTALPGGFNDVMGNMNYCWIQYATDTSGNVIKDSYGNPSKIKGADDATGHSLGFYLEANEKAYMCPTFAAQDNLGGDKAICHYAMPTRMSGLSTGLIVGGFATYTDKDGKQQTYNFRGAAMIVEPLVRLNDDGTIDNDLGTYDPGSSLWTTPPNGAFEQGKRLALTRHMEATNICFHDGHAETIKFPGSPAQIKAENLNLTLSSGGTSKTIDMGGAGNQFNSWMSAPAAGPTY